MEYTDFMVLPRGVHSMVKTLEFFTTQGGTDDNWGKGWRSVKASNIEHARFQAQLMTPVLDGHGWPRVTREHIRQTHVSGEECDGSCNICNLFVCLHCKAFEGGLSTDCPFRIITAEESDAIYKGELDFYQGEWVTNHRSRQMYPQDSHCEFCRGENPQFDRQFFTADFKLWHRAIKYPGITVRCGYGKS